MPGYEPERHTEEWQTHTRHCAYVIHYARLKKGLSINRLAYLAGCDASTIWRIEYCAFPQNPFRMLPLGHSGILQDIGRAMSLSLAYKLASVLDIPMNVFMMDTPWKKKRRKKTAKTNITLRERVMLNAPVVPRIAPRVRRKSRAVQDNAEGV